MFSPIDTRIIDENVDTAYRNSINNSQLLMKMSILRIEICINNLCIDGIKHQYPGSAPGWPYTPQKRFIGPKSILNSSLLNGIYLKMFS